jgi:hypothetical protein
MLNPEEAVSMSSYNVRTVVALLFVLMGGFAHADDNRVFVWKFTEMRKMEGLDSYSFEVSRQTGGGRHSSFGSTMHENILRRLVGEFKVDRPEELLGKEISLPDFPGNPDFEIWLINREMPRYFMAPPTSQAIRSMAASALSMGKEPVFFSVSHGYAFSQDIANAFEEVFKFAGGGVDNSWLRLFSTEVLEMSHGYAQLFRPSPEEEKDFPFPKRSGEDHLLLVVDGVKHRLVIGPWTNPINFIGETPGKF